MDLDIPAWSAYAIIVVISTYAAINQVQKLLKNVPWRWTFVESYILFVSFFALPIALFWALDRVGALHDCSLISALIVALTYQAIVNGKSESSNSAVSAVFKPILEWMNTIPERLGERTQADNAEFATSVANAVGRDDGLLAVLDKWVTDHTDDLVALQLRMREFDTEPATQRPPGLVAGSLESREWSRRKAQRLALFVEPTLPVRIGFLKRRLTTFRSVWRAVVRLDQTIRWGIPTLLVVLLAFSFISWFQLTARTDAKQTVLSGLNINNVMPRYHSWRYLKTNNTATDIRRALANLSSGLESEIPVWPNTNVKSTQPIKTPNSGVEGADPVYSRQVTSILQQKEITIALADDLLKTVFAGRLHREHMPTACAAMVLLPPALRSQNVEIRNLIKKSMGEASTALWGPLEQSDAVPNDDAGPDADTVAIEVAVVDWTGFITKHCAEKVAQKPAPAPSTTRTIVLPDVNFEFDSAVLRATAFAALDSVAAEFRSRESLHAELNGYTDSIGTARYNLKLSGNRANSVRDYLVAHGVKPDVLSANCFGAANPVGPNTTEEGRAKNRRVEIKIRDV